MSVRSISLRKLIKILFAPANRSVSEIRKDIPEDMKRSQDATAGGGDLLRLHIADDDDRARHWRFTRTGLGWRGGNAGDLAK